MRQQAKRDEGTKKHFSHTSPRTLLGVLRLSQALARLRFAEQVIAEDVDEALRLIEVSKASLWDNEGRHGADQTPSSKIYNLVRNMKDSGAAAVGDGSGELDLRRVKERVLAKGFTEDQFDRAVEEYESLDVSLLQSPDFVFNQLPWERLLTNECRCGKLLQKVPDLCLLRLTMKTQIWMRTIRACIMGCSRLGGNGVGIHSKVQQLA
jgi:DNA replication licensing factor MCM7